MKAILRPRPSRASILWSGLCAVPLLGVSRAADPPIPQTVPADPVIHRGPIPRRSPNIPVITITGVPTSATAFVGQAPQGPVDVASSLQSFSDFQQLYGGSDSPLGNAVNGFFQNGGGSAYVVRTSAPNAIGDPQSKTGIFALDTVAAVDVLVAPLEVRSESPFGLSAARKAFNLALARYAVARRAMFILDPPGAWSAAAKRGAFSHISPAADLFGVSAATPELANCAVYFGRIGGLTKTTYLPAGGAVAGIWAQTDASRGVWKAPAGTGAALAGTTGIDVDVNDTQSATLTTLGVNPIRTFAGRPSPIVFGARTLSPDTQWKYIPVRRFALYVESSILSSAQFAVFESDAPLLWNALRNSIGSFMQSLFLKGALQGTTPQQAYFVKCDASTNTQAQIASGIVNVVIGFAPLVAAEFVILQIALTGAASSATAAPH